jgi:hypothetical protein
VRGAAALAGNGAGLVRERALAMAVQHGLERLYQLDGLAEVDPFVTSAETGEREVLLVRQVGGDIEVSLRLPTLGGSELELDPLCQIIEGVSHFVYLADRARSGREATQLEMELQAEVDKYVILAASLGAVDPPASARLRARLYDQVRFSHDAETELGERYRMANELASKFVRRLERDYLASRRYGEMHACLRDFYRMGQEEKLRVGRAA